MTSLALRARLVLRVFACLLTALAVVPMRGAEKMDEFTQAQIAALGEAQGRTFPADRINPKNTALVHAHEARVGEILKQVTTDRARAFGK